MKVFPTLLALAAVAFVSCERHEWEETKKLHEQHHGAGHGEHAEGHGDAEHGDAHHGETKAAEGEHQEAAH
ncbi:MAG TPA: hypothetical protein VIM46_01005 [Luteolibacter sp.]